jgi:hypothetical protein
MTRLVVLALATALLGGGLDPGAAVPSADHAYDLVGTWSCRTSQDATERLDVTREGDDLAIAIDVTPRRAAQFAQSVTVRHVRSNTWSLTSTLQGRPYFEGTASAWIDASWSFEGHFAGRTEPWRERYEKLPDGTLRRTLSGVVRSVEIPDFVELCRRGAEPPTPTCLLANQVGRTLYAAIPKTPPEVRRLGITGIVTVLVKLDEDSNIVLTRIQTSPSALLNEPALEATQHSVFQTSIRDCRPVAGEFIFSVAFNRIR